MSSRRKHLWVLIGAVAALAFAIVFEPAYGWRLRAALEPQDVMSAADPALPAQNQALEAQLASLESIAAQLPQNSSGSIPAVVYSQYPFDFHNELLIGSGANQGIAVGKAVTFQGVFIGLVARVFSDEAVVRTVFDPSFKMPVRVGSHGIDALLEGGPDPKAASIAKTASVAMGDVIYTAAPGVPYGLPVAAIAATSTSADHLFQEASLNFAYDINTVESVLIAK